MDELILRCGRYYPPAQSGDAERLRRLENYVGALSSDAEALFESCERLRREIARHMAELEEKVDALSAAASGVAVLAASVPEESAADGDQNAPTSDA